MFFNSWFLVPVISDNAVKLADAKVASAKLRDANVLDSMVDVPIGDDP